MQRSSALFYILTLILCSIKVFAIPPTLTTGKIEITKHTLALEQSLTPAHTLIYFKRPGNWGTNINLYAWISTSNGTKESRGSWPGTSINHISQNWYSTTLATNEFDSNGTLKIIFNDAEHQTANLSRNNTEGESHFIIDSNSNGPIYSGQWFPGRPGDLDPPTLTEISIDNAPLVLAVQNNITLAVTGHYSNNSSQTLTDQLVFSSADSNIASVSGATLTGVSEGNTTLSVSYDNRFTAQANVSVRNRVIDSFPIYFENQSNWAQVCIYAWTENPSRKIYGAWPGKPITDAVDNFYQNDIAYTDLDSSNAINLIFNNCGNGAQTTDLRRTKTQGEGYFNNNGWNDGSPFAKTKIEVVSGEPSGLHEFRVGEVITITADTAPDSMKFSHWSGSGSSLITNTSVSSFPFTVPESSQLINFTANYSDLYADGKRYFSVYCSGCHGSFGEGDIDLVNISDRYTLASLTTKIENTMPSSASEQCVDDCARETARLIFASAYDRVSFACNNPVQPLNRRFRLLTKSEYQYTLMDLFKLENVEIDDKNWPTETRSGGVESFTGGYTNATSRIVSGQHLEDYVAIGKQVAPLVNLEALSGCTDNQCIVDYFLLRGLKRPPTATEVSTYLEVLEQKGADRFIIQLLSSPYFVYRSEQGVQNGDFYNLTAYEVASLLSYMFWESLPDDTLLNAAKNDELSTAAQINTQAQRLANDARFARSIHHFVEGWLGIYRVKNVSKTKPLSSGLRHDMLLETQLFMQDLITSGSNYRDIYLADYSYLTANLATHYNISDINEPQPQKVSYAAGHPRSGIGILGHSSIHTSFSKADNSFPVRRGLFVRRKLLCQQLPSPVGINNDVGAPEPGETSRQHLERATAGQPCASCHAFMNGQGYTFENFDEIGQFRTSEIVDGQQYPIDASGVIYNINVQDSSFVSDYGRSDTTELNGLASLAQSLANSTNGATCFARQYYHYSAGLYDLDMHSYCRIKPSTTRFAQGNQSIKDYIIGLTQSEFFTVRK